MSLRSAATVITIKDDIPQMDAALYELRRRQLPFAAAKALTKTAEDARDAARKMAVAVMKIRKPTNSQGPLRRINIQRAEKKQWPNPYARVGIRDRYIKDHVFSAVRPGKTRSRTVPSDDNPANSPSGKTSRGKIPRKWSAEGLLDKSRKRHPKGFLIDLNRGGLKMILMQEKKKRRKKKRTRRPGGYKRPKRTVLMFLAPDQEIEKRFPFNLVVRKAVNEHGPRNLNRALLDAMFTAKKVTRAEKVLISRIYI